jgi:uncharacterized membrane protein
MSYGPVELLVVAFPETRMRGDVVPAVKELVESGTVRIIDFVFITKDSSGTVTKLEINDLDDDHYATFNPVVSDITGLLSDDDVQQLAATLENNSSAAFMLFENTWATRFRDAVVNAGARVVLIERIPASVIEETLAEQALVTA